MILHDVIINDMHMLYHLKCMKTTMKVRTFYNALE